MKLTIVRLTVVCSLFLLPTIARAQQTYDDTKIVKMRATIEKLEGLAVDANIPAETRDQLAELLFEKRGELHALVRQKREALRASLQKAASDQERNSLNETISQLTREMQQLSGGAAPVAVAAPPAPVPPTPPATDGSYKSPTQSPPPTNGHSQTPPATNGYDPPAATNGNSKVMTSMTAEAKSSVAPAPAPVPQVTPQTYQTGTPSGPDPCAALAASAAPSTLDYQREIQAASCRMLAARTGKGNTGDAQLDFRNYTVVLALGLAGAKIEKVAVPELTAQAENGSYAKNVTANGPSSGGTSLASKAGIPAIFGLAVENGALTKTTDGTTVTFAGNPVGLIQTLAKKGYIDSFQQQDELTGFLRKLSFGLSFDTSRGNDPGTFTASRQQLSGFSFKYNVLDQRDPRRRKYTNRWRDITRKQATKLALSLNSFVLALASKPGVPAFNTWLENANQALAAKTDYADIESTLTTELEKLGNIDLPLELEALVKEVGTDFDDFIEERNNILDEISNGWVATFDYNNERPAGLPSLSNFRFLIEKGAYNGSLDFTGNASLTLYNSRPTAAATPRLRDFRFSAQLDVPIGDITKTGKFMLSFAGNYQRLLNDQPLDGTSIIIRKGDIAVGQVKLTIPIRGTALKFPISFTVANRTELIQEKEVRGNFGVTFDIDSILAKFNPFNRY